MFEKPKNRHNRINPPYKGSITHSSANTKLLESSCSVLRRETLMEIFGQQENSAINSGIKQAAGRKSS